MNANSSATIFSKWGEIFGKSDKALYTKYTLKDTFVNKIAKCALKKKVKGFSPPSTTVNYEILPRERHFDLGAHLHSVLFPKHRFRL